MSGIKAYMSPTAQAFGARIDQNIEGRGLYLVIGKGSLAPTVQGHANVQIVVKLSSNKLLATMPIETYFALKSHPEVSLIGPVELDQSRFAAFMTLLGIDAVAQNQG